MLKATQASFAVAAMLFFVAQAQAEDPWVVYEGKSGLGKGKHIVFVSGDEEYRSEELIPQLAKILAKHHGFKCTVLFAIDKKDGTINPQQLDNIPGLEKLKDADLMVLFVRFRNLPDDQMKHIIDYVETGKPIVALRTSTHAFRIPKGSKYYKYDWRHPEFRGGFGRQILGETWVSHYGRHKSESTRGVVAKGMEKHPIVQGCEDIWGPSDVYKVNTLTGDSKPVIMGQVLTGMKPTDKQKPGSKLMPIAWIKSYTPDPKSPDKKNRIFVTTMGHGGDLQSEGVRRLLTNAAFWCVGMVDWIPERAKVDLVGEYNPAKIGVGGHKKGIKPSDLKMGS